LDKEIAITLPDGQQKIFTTGVTGLQVASHISKSLAKSALACSINGSIKDLS
jgi:threonyl-tRNA synthetase